MKEGTQPGITPESVAAKYHELAPEAQRTWNEARMLGAIFARTTFDAAEPLTTCEFAGFMRVLFHARTVMLGRIADLENRLDQMQRDLNARDGAEPADPCAGYNGCKLDANGVCVNCGEPL